MAELNNRTPFSPMVFETLDLDDDPFQVIVLRGTFSIENAKPLKPIQKQRPVRLAPEYFGSANESSLRADDDLAPYKANADIVVDAVAHSPGGVRLQKWQVEVHVGALSKILRVHGPRWWQKSATGEWILTEATPVSEVPVRYEATFGGSWSHGDRAGVFEQNPCGKGFVGPLDQVDVPEIPAPQIESPGAPIGMPGQETAPQGLGPISKAWLPRRRYAGTFDTRWQLERHPRLPLDFSVDFYNSAHPDLVYDGFLHGDESVTLVSLSSHGDLTFQLPDYEILGSLTDHSGFTYGNLFNLDTLEIDVERMSAGLVWRLCLPIYEDGIARIDTRMQENARRGKVARGRASTKATP